MSFDPTPLPPPLDQCLALVDKYDALPGEDRPAFRQFCCDYWMSLEDRYGVCRYPNSWSATYMLKISGIIRQFALKIGKIIVTESSISTPSAAIPGMQVTEKSMLNLLNELKYQVNLLIELETRRQSSGSKK